MPRRPSPSRIKTHRVYTPWEAADALGFHRQTVRRWIKDKGLPAEPLGPPAQPLDSLRQVIGLRPVRARLSCASHAPIPEPLLRCHRP